MFSKSVYFYIRLFELLFKICTFYWKVRTWVWRKLRMQLVRNLTPLKNAMRRHLRLNCKNYNPFHPTPSLLRQTLIRNARRDLSECFVFVDQTPFVKEKNVFLPLFYGTYFHIHVTLVLADSIGFVVEKSDWLGLLHADAPFLTVSNQDIIDLNLTNYTRPDITVWSCSPYSSDLWCLPECNKITRKC